MGITQGRHDVRDGGTGQAGSRAMYTYRESLLSLRSYRKERSLYMGDLRVESTLIRALGNRMYLTGLSVL